jgi:hypothetical protein
VSKDRYTPSRLHQNLPQMWTPAAGHRGHGGGARGRWKRLA